MSTTYRLRREHANHPAGTIVYKCTGCTYGLASDDSRYTGIEHTAVTLDENGGYPFFTVPVQDLEEVVFSVSPTFVSSEKQQPISPAATASAIDYEREEAEIKQYRHAECIAFTIKREFDMYRLHGERPMEMSLARQIGMKIAKEFPL